MKKHSKGKYYIVKPDNGCQGRGIHIVDNPKFLGHETGIVVQQYLMNPLLIDGLKFDLRIYALVTCVNPLRIYLYREGIARFATESSWGLFAEFEKPNLENIGNVFTHLTNYAINKHNSVFEVGKSATTGHKRLLWGLFGAEESERLMQKVAKIVIKSVISVLPMLQSGLAQTGKNDPNSCFQLLGFDIMLDDQREPFLIEINQNPSLATETLLDENLKSALVRNVLEMVTGNFKKDLTKSEMQSKLEQSIRMKDKHEMETANIFSRVYPSDNFEQTESYDELIICSQKVYRDRFGLGIVRNERRSRELSRLEIEQQQAVQWNEMSNRYSREKVEKIYSNKYSLTAHEKRRNRLPLQGTFNDLQSYL